MKTKKLEGRVLEHITTTAGPSKFELMVSVFSGKIVPIAIKEAEKEHPHNIFDARFYGVEVGDNSSHYLSSQHVHSDNGDGLLSSKDVMWKVKVAIYSKNWDNTVRHLVYYTGVYNPITGQSSLSLDNELSE